MLYLSKVLLYYVLIVNLEISFNFHLTFLQLNVITECSLCSKNCFFLTPGYLFRAPDNSNLFRFRLKVRVIAIGSRL